MYTLTYHEGDNQVTYIAPTLEEVFEMREWDTAPIDESDSEPVQVRLNECGGLEVMRSESEELEEAVRYRNEEIERLQAANTTLRNQANLVQEVNERMIDEIAAWKTQARNNGRLADDALDEVSRLKQELAGMTSHAQAPKAPTLPLMRAASLCTLKHTPYHVRMEFEFKSLDEMYAADKEWVQFVEWAGRQP